MEKKVSKRKQMAWNLGLLAGALLTAVSLAASWWVTAFFILWMVVCAVGVRKTQRCPHCGAYFRGLFPQKKDAGYCRQCGKLIEFDE